MKTSLKDLDRYLPEKTFRLIPFVRKFFQEN